MKKSEMIDMISQTICEASMEDDSEELAEKILDVIVKAGMQPPSITFQMGELNVTDNSWEPDSGQH